MAIIHSIPSAANHLITALVIAYHGLLLLALPLFLSSSSHWAVVILPIICCSIAQWGLIHEAIHKHLHPHRAVNEFMGRLLAILLGTSFHVLRFGHLMHHQLNRQWQSEMVTKTTWNSRITYYWHLFAGLYVTEVLSTFLLAITPNVVIRHAARRYLFRHCEQAAESSIRFFFHRGMIHSLRFDALSIAILYGTSFYLYGIYWPVLVLAIILRAVTISFMDNIYHYETPADNSRAAKELSMPPWLQLLMLNSNYHETHHLHPDVPWTLLPAQHREDNRSYDGPIWCHGLRQLRGPVANLPVA